MKKTPLRRRSKKLEAWNALYLSEKALRIKNGENCQRCHGDSGGLQGHHYANSKAGANRLRFVILCAPCHACVTENMNTARVLGWQAEINGAFSHSLPAVERAEKRYQELLETLKLPIL